MRDLMRGIGGQFVVLLAVWGLASVCEAAPPEDPIGNWKLKCICPDAKSRECIFIISREGEALKARYKADGVTRAARAVTFDEGILSVRVDGNFAGSKYGLTYKGKLEGDTLCGDVHWSYLWTSGKFAFKGERIEEKDVAAR